MKKFILLLSVAIYHSIAFPQKESNVLQYTLEEIEALFLKENLELLAARLDISIADAHIAQEKSWDNPTFSLGNVNLWSTGKQREGEKEVIPPLFGSFGRNMEFSVELSQMIRTAGKRKKRVEIGKTSKEISILEFEDLLRSLKTELRKSVYEYTYLNALSNILNRQLESLTGLTRSWEQQVEKGNLPRTELLRLQAALFEVENEYNELSVEVNQHKKNIRMLMNLPPGYELEIIPDANTLKIPEEIQLGKLIDQSSGARPDVRTSELRSLFYKKEMAYEKAQRVPDITLSAVYDRYGGVWRDFVGFGISFELPVFNRNKGNIEAARLSSEQHHHLATQRINLISNEITNAFDNYTQAYGFYKKMESNSILKELDKMYEIYIQSLMNRNISMVEFIDFMEAYKNNKQTFLNADKNRKILFEELQYTVGADIN